jgi:hypothetical protein
MSRERGAQPPHPAAATQQDTPSTADERMRFVVSQNAQGEPTLEVIDGSFEQSYRIGDAYTTKLFLELCRSRGLLPYRHKRQHAGTLCVRAPLAEHDALWTSFLELSRQLEAKLYEVTCAFVSEAIERSRQRR